MHARHRRTLRGVAASATATLTAAAAHTLAGGGAPGPLLVGAAIVLASPVAVLLAGRRVAVWRTTAMVLSSQLLLHIGFALTAGLDPAMGGSHAHHSAALLPSGPVDLIPDATMSACHAAAAVFTIVLLYRGERMLAALSRGLVRILGLTVSLGPLPLVGGEQTAPEQRPFGLLPHVAISDLSRRGPPSAFAAAVIL
jgi:hypothetical protein